VDSSTCVLFALLVCCFTGGVLCKASLGYGASSTCVLFALWVCGFTDSVYCHSIQESKVVASSSGVVNFRVGIKDNLQ